MRLAEATPWEIWTELVIPAASAGATVVVAVAALVLSWRSTREDRRARVREADRIAEERGRRARSDLLPVFAAYLRELSENPLEEASGDTILSLYDHSASVKGGQQVADWVRNEAASAKFELGRDAKTPGGLQAVKFAVRASILDRLRGWVETGELDASSIVREPWGE